MDDALLRSPLKFFYLILAPVCLPVACSHLAYARDVFNYRALEVGLSEENRKALHQFTENDDLLPGKYRVDVYVNGFHVDNRDVDFSVDRVSKTLQPRLTKEDYIALGVKPEASEKFTEFHENTPIPLLADYIPQAHTEMQLDRLRLNISVPQVAMQPSAGNYVPPKLWDDGVSALFVNYSMSGANGWSRDDDSQDRNYYLNLNNGINLGAWRLRNYSSYSYNGSGWDSINTYAWRNITQWSSKFTIGETSTGSDIFDSFQFRGIKLESNDNMRPWNARGFAPSIQGIAQSNAEITVSQNGHIIYQTYVAPGPFEITDLSPVYSGGDMEVKIKESDGQERSFIQASSSVPIMRRAGSFAYSFSGGSYRASDNHIDEPGFIEGTLIYGLPWGATVYGGLLGAEKYQSAALGIGLDLHQFGSISSDVTAAKTTLTNGHDDEDKGHSLRVQYAREFADTGTNLTLAGYRYSTRHYYTFSEALNHNSNDDDDSIFSYQNDYTRHRRLQLNISQSLHDLGSLNLSAYQQDYWGMADKERSVSLGYSNNWGSASYSLNYTHTQTPFSDSDTQFSLTLSIPLDRLLAGTRVSYSYNGDSDGKAQNSLGFSGSALENNNLSWGIQENYTNQGVGNGGNASANWRTRRAIVTAGYSYDKHSDRVNYGLQGALVAHPKGVTLSQPLGDTSILVNIPDVPDTKVNNGTAVYTDIFGNSIIPYASPFQRNNVVIDTKTLPEGADLQLAVQEVIPTEGAIAMAKFEARQGHRLLLTLNHHGKPVPFSATVTVEGDSTHYSGLVDDRGRVYLSGIMENQTLQVQWGNSADTHCTTLLTSEMFTQYQPVAGLSVSTATCS